MRNKCITKQVSNNVRSFFTKTNHMKKETLRNDLFLYDLTIRVLAFWATILFSLLFFTGAQANEKAGGVNAKKSAVYTHEIKSDRK